METLFAITKEGFRNTRTELGYQNLIIFCLNCETYLSRDFGPIVLPSILMEVHGPTKEICETTPDQLLR